MFKQTIHISLNDNESFIKPESIVKYLILVNEIIFKNLYSIAFLLSPLNQDLFLVIVVIIFKYHIYGC